jgi:hypothetical protein
MDKNAVCVMSLSDPSGERTFWQSQTPQERLAAVELLRTINYGYDPATARLQRVLTVVELRGD